MYTNNMQHTWGGNEAKDKNPDEADGGLLKWIDLYVMTGQNHDYDKEYNI